MNADDAFSNLMNRNALPIPVVAAEKETDGEKLSADVRTAPGRTSESEDNAAHVLEMLDRGQADYNPDVAAADDDGVYATPTETDLEPLPEDFDPEAAREPYNDDFDSDAPSGFGREPDNGRAGLDLARRVRRFAYLPLAENKAFEHEARDLVASLQSQDPNRHSLAVTSPARGNGGTELAIRLALAMAKRVDYRVLLADFDTRKPQVAARLGLTAKHFALADVLRGSCPLGEALLFSEEDNLFVLPARASDRDGDEFLDDRQVQGLLAQVHQVFDFTIIGCGPMTHADAATVCRHAGTSALAGFCGFTRIGDLREAAEKLIGNGARVAGLVLTGA